MTLLQRDVNGLAALAKPAGVLSHPNTPRDEARSLVRASYAMEGEYYTWREEGTGAPARLWLLNRLDAATSGVILVAADAVLADAIREHFLRQKIHKAYVALVFGVPVPAVQLWRDRLAVDKRGGRIRTTTQGPIPAEARMSVLRRARSDPPCTLIKLEPRTGRSHQLRVQCAQRRLPIVGDATYGRFEANRAFAQRTGCKRMFLHSLETRFDYHYRGRTFSFSAQAPLPPEFTTVE